MIAGGYLEVGGAVSHALSYPEGNYVVAGPFCKVLFGKNKTWVELSHKLGLGVGVDDDDIYLGFQSTVKFSFTYIRERKVPRE